MASAKLCSIAGCDKNSYVRGWCTKHYQRWQLHGDPMRERPKLPELCTHVGCSKKASKRGLCHYHYSIADFRRECSLPGCSAKVSSNGLCLKHSKRKWRHGSTDAVLRLHNGAYLEWYEANRDHDGDECLIWPYHLNKRDGRPPLITVNGKKVTAARHMCTLANGAPPSSKHEAAHSCGNGHIGCLNPKHLRWATRLENREDMILHGRSLRGERHPLAKLAIDDVLAIRARAENGEALRGLAKSFGVSRGTISDIKSGRTWAWL